MITVPYGISTDEITASEIKPKDQDAHSEVSITELNLHRVKANE